MRSCVKRAIAGKLSLNNLISLLSVLEAPVMYAMRIIRIAQSFNVGPGPPGGFAQSKSQDLLVHRIAFPAFASRLPSSWFEFGRLALRRRFRQTVSCRGASLLPRSLNGQGASSGRRSTIFGEVFNGLWIKNPP